METKKWYQSKTIQVAAIQLVIAVIVFFMSKNSNLELGGMLLALKSIFDIFLRLVTTTSIE